MGTELTRGSCARRKYALSVKLTRVQETSLPKRIASFSVSFSLSRFYVSIFASRRAHIENRLQRLPGRRETVAAC